jgi:NAD(P)-dependent dehydrogenase (short-subunit alcohol dehydrogenase family)
MNKLALITGGNSGIGRATAQLMSEAGYEVVISGRNEAELGRAAQELGVSSTLADMGKMDDVKALGARFSDGLDVLVNNAGIASLIPLGLYREEDFWLHFGINVQGPIFLMQELLSALEQRRGCVVNISSISASRGAAGAGLYAATKGALEAITGCLAIELAPRGIRVNAVSPGAIDTPIFSKLGIPPDTLKAMRLQHEAAIPLRRFGDPMEVAKVVLAQVEATYVTGAVWTVDGGLTA